MWHSFYHMGNEHETYQYLEQTIVPMICNTVRGRVVCTWAVSNGFGNMYEAVRELDHAAEWNLILKKGTLICKEKIQKIALYPYKYPVNLEKEAKEALLNKDAKRLKKNIFQILGLLQGTSMYPAGGQGGLYPYCTGSDPDGSGNRGGTGTEKRTDISSMDFQGKWMDRCGRKSGYFFLNI